MTHFQVTNTQSGRRSSATTHSPTSPVQVRTEVSIRGYNFSWHNYFVRRFSPTVHHHISYPHYTLCAVVYRGADKSLARPGRKQARKHVRDARDFNNIETQAVIKFFFPAKGKAPKEIHAILTETLAYELIYQLNAIEYLLCNFSSTCFGLTRPSSEAMDVKFLYIYSIWCPWCS